MSKTIKVIDLLNMISKREKMPEFVRYFHRISKQFEIMLVCKENIIDKLDRDIIDLNDEVEIIEEEPEINIQSIEEQGQFCNLIGLTENEEILWKMIQSNANVIDEVIRAAKQLDRQINNK